MSTDSHDLNRREFLELSADATAFSMVGLSPFAGAQAQHSSNQNQARKSNVVYFLVDNLGMGELSSYSGGPYRGVTTTRIDNFAKEGMMLLNFGPEAQCTPSRSADDWTPTQSVPGITPLRWPDRIAVS